MKVKRLVSLLLAALLLVGMIPMNAFAWANKEDAGNDLAEIEVMISTNPPRTVSTSEYLPSYEGTDLKEDNIIKNVKTANAAWDGVKWDESTQQFVGNREISAEPGDIVYVGFKIRHINPSEYIGIALGTAILQFDTDVMTYSNEDHVLSADALIQEMYTNDASKDGSPVIGNLLSQSFARQDISNYTEPVKEILKKYIGSLKMNADGTGYRNESYVLTGYLSLMFNRQTASQFSVSNASAWDFVVPMKVLESATKGDTLFVSAPSESTATGVTLTKISPNRSGNTVGSSTDNKSLGTEAELITNSVTVKVEKKSDPIDMEMDYSKSITNNPNMPYLSMAEAAKEVNGGHGPNDYITFPEEEKTFQVNEKIYVYADAEGKTELGHTTLKAENFYKPDDDGNLTGDMYTSLPGEFKVAGSTLRLVKEDDDGNVIGYGYIKDHKKVWIGRLNPNTEGAGDLNVVVDTSKLKEVEVTPETSLNFDGNVDALTTGKGSSKEDAIKVNLNDPVSGALLQDGVDRTTFGSNVNAPVEGSSKTVPTTVDWTSNWVAANTDGTGKLFADKFIKHGFTTIVAPFKATSKELALDGPDAPKTTVEYHQPANMVEVIGDRIQAVEPTPVYGSQIHVKVNPNPTDYLATVNDDNNTGTLTVIGDSKGIWKEVQEGGTTVNVYLSTSGALNENGMFQTTLSTGEITFGRPSSDLYGAVNVTADMPPVGDTVYVLITEGPTANPNIKYDVFEVPVAKSGYRVNGDAQLTNVDANTNMLVQASETVENIFKAADPVFTIVSDQANEAPQEIHLMDLYTASDLGTSVFKTADVKVTVEGVAEKSWTGTQYDSDEEQVKTNRDPNDVVTFTYKIPSAPEGGYYLNSVARAGEPTQVKFSNDLEYQVVIDARIVKQLTLSDNGDGAKIKTTILENNPLGEKDVFIIQGDTKHYNDQNATDPATVKAGDTVSVFENNELLTEGKITKVTDNANQNEDKNGGASGTTTYFVEVDQLGHTVDPSKLTYVISRVESGSGAQSLLPSEEYQFSADTNNVLEEVYSLVKVQDYSPNTFVVAKASGQTVESVIAANAPKTATLEVAYKKEANGDYVIDETTTKQITIDLPAGKSWDKGDNATVDLLKGDKPITFTLPLVDEGEDSKVWTVTPKGDSTTPIKVRPYKDEGGENFVKEKTLEIFIELVGEDAVYYGPAMSDIVKALSANNYRYPKKDNVALKGTFTFTDKKPAEDAKLTVYIYATEDDATNGQNAIAEFKDMGEGSFDGARDLADPLAVLGGTLYVRAMTSHSLPEEDQVPGTFTFGSEPYTFWGVSLDGEEVISLNRTQITEGGRDTLAKQIDFVMAQLPSTFKVAAVRFTNDGSGVVVDESSMKTLSVKLENPWDRLSAETMNKMMETKPTSNAEPVKARITNAALAGAKVSDSIKVSDGEAGEAEYEYVLSTVEYDVPEGAPARENDETVTRKIMITDNEDDRVFDVPDYYGTKYIEASRGDKLEDYTDDTVKFEFKYEESEENQVAMAGVTYEFTIQKPDSDEETTVSSKFNSGDPVSELIGVVEGNANKFYGFHRDTTSFDVYFIKELSGGKTQKSAPIPVSVPAMSGVEEVKAIALKNPLTLELTTGSILKDSDLTDLLTDGDWNKPIESVLVETDTKTGDARIEIPLVKTAVSEGSSAGHLAETPVNWKLWKASDGEPNFSTAKAFDQFKTEMSTVADTSGEETYYLLAQLDKDEVEKANLAYNENLLAKVEIKLYDMRKDAFPLKMTEGNSDLWQLQKDGTTATAAEKETAKAEMDARSTADELSGANVYKPEDFKYDAVFYYHTDVYDASSYAPVTTYERHEVKPYVESGIDSLADDEGFADWLKTAGDAVKVEQLKDDGSKISQQKYNASGAADGDPVNYIEPRFSERVGDYFERGVSYTRAEEEYVIRYKVRYEGKVYVIARNVKLTYRPGDVDLSGTAVDIDAQIFNNMVRDGQQPFGEADDFAKKVNDKIWNVNRDAYSNDLDAQLINNAVRDGTTFNLRW